MWIKTRKGDLLNLARVTEIELSCPADNDNSSPFRVLADGTLITAFPNKDGYKAAEFMDILRVKLGGIVV